MVARERRRAKMLEEYRGLLREPAESDPEPDAEPGAELDPGPVPERGPEPVPGADESSGAAAAQR